MISNALIFIRLGYTSLKRITRRCVSNGPEHSSGTPGFFPASSEVCLPPEKQAEGEKLKMYRD